MQTNVHIADGARELTIALHCNHRTGVEQFTKAGQGGALVTVALNGLSGVYRERFADPRAFFDLVAQAEREAGRTFDRVALIAFSAGFGGVREILNQPKAAERVDRLLMLDSIHAGYEADGIEPRKDQMAPFVRFARLAAEGKRRMAVTHSQVRPAGYASTTETADALAGALELRWRSASENLAPRLKLYRRCDRGRLTLLGFAGDTGEDHMQHLREMGVFLKLLSDGP
ncbi:MAG: hypothetical protein HUU60_11615 [Armatimonadetes bacterium]|nr:hypothetical protein [Armatimonadota bacterium]